MILNIKSQAQRRSDKRERDKQWHPWFAWYPLRFNSKKVVWLQKVYRRADYYGGWEFVLTNPLKVENT
jgi:hypothetical protein